MASIESHLAEQAAMEAADEALYGWAEEQGLDPEAPETMALWQAEMAALEEARGEARGEALREAF